MRRTKQKTVTAGKVEFSAKTEKEADLMRRSHVETALSQPTYDPIVVNLDGFGRELYVGYYDPTTPSWNTLFMRSTGDGNQPYPYVRQSWCVQNVQNRKECERMMRRHAADAYGLKICDKTGEILCTGLNFLLPDDSEGIQDIERRGEALSARKRAELAGKSEAECKDAYDLVYYRSRR